MKTWLKTVIVVVAVLVVIVILINVTPAGRKLINNWKYGLEKVDEGTYENQKEVEDTCRAMIASYEADKLTYEQYKDSTKDNELEWAAGAKMRANRTAANYNTYYMQNSFVWKDNVPSDIYTLLDTLE